MPILVYKGDTIDNFGKYLPTPYIERVTIYDEAACSVLFSIFMKIDENEKINDVLARLNDQLNIYLFFVLNKEKVIQGGTTSVDAGHDHEYSMGAEGNGRAQTWFKPGARGIRHGHTIVNGIVQESQSTCYPNCEEAEGSEGIGPHTHNLQFNESIERVLSGELNIFEYYRAVYETNDNSTHSLVYLTKVLDDLSEKNVVEEFYDENGDRIFKFSATIGFQPLDTLTAGATAYEWSEANDFTILSFSSTFNYSEGGEGLDEELKNEAFFNKQTSDIAYERIFKDGILVSQLQVEFFDSSNTIYNGTPLQSINGVYYKAENITHITIVDYFNELLRQVAAPRHSKLQKWKDKVAYILGIYGDKADLLYQLNLLRKVFPDKSGATPLGNFYFRFKKRVFATNKNVQTNAQLSRKVIRNPKFIDARSAPESVGAATTWKETWTGHDYLYNQGYMGRTALYSLPGTEQISEYDTSIYANGTDVTEWEVQANTLTMAAWDENSQDFDAIVRNAGYFFFDYEKALRYVANINQLVDVEKLIKYGVPVDYNKFRISKVRIKRVYEGMLNPESQFQGGYVQIEADFDSSLSYPLTTTSLVEESAEGLPTGLVINSPGFYSDYTPSGAESKKLVLTQEEHTSLMIRNFEPVQTNEISSRIPNYRLICFEFQDFMDDDVATLYGWESIAAGPNEYETEVVVTDESQKILTEFIRKYVNSQSQLESYIAAADLDFSYDESTGLFNEFFIDGIEAIYSANIAEAPWYRAPVLYNLHRDLVFNTFGGNVEAIFEDAQNIMNAINPFNGSYYSLIEFNEKMRQFYEDTYSFTSSGSPMVLDRGIGTLSEEKVFQSTLSFNSAGNTGEPYGVVYSTSADYDYPPDTPVDAPFPIIPMIDDLPTYPVFTGGSDDDISE